MKITAIFIGMPYLILWIWNYTAPPQQKGLTHNFLKIELIFVSWPECWYIYIETIKQPLLGSKPPKYNPKFCFYVQVAGVSAQ